MCCERRCVSAIDAGACAVTFWPQRECFSSVNADAANRSIASRAPTTSPARSSFLFHSALRRLLEQEGGGGRGGFILPSAVSRKKETRRKGEREAEEKKIQQSQQSDPEILPYSYTVSAYLICFCLLFNHCSNILYVGLNLQ